MGDLLGSFLSLESQGIRDQGDAYLHAFCSLLPGWLACLPVLRDCVSGIGGCVLLGWAGELLGWETARAAPSGISPRRLYLLALGLDPIHRWALGSYKAPKLEPEGGWVSESPKQSEVIPLSH